MSDQALIEVYRFWEILVERGHMTYEWWYQVAVMPVVVIAFFSTC